MNRAAAQFPLRLGIAMLNHASFGLATTSLLERAEDHRLAIEAEPVEMLTDNLNEGHAEVLAETAEWLGLDAARTALTLNATSGAAAVEQSLALGPDDHVVILRAEYPSILRGWERRCAETGATLHIVDVPVPLDTVGAVLERLDAVPAERVAVLQFSGIASATAVHLPVADVAAWGRDRGARIVLDGAHMPGHVALDEWAVVDAAFGTLHKWLPVPRSVGVLYAAPDTAPLLRPAETTLTWDADDLGERFAWPGTFDPAPRLVLPEAIAVWRAFEDSGAHARAARMADAAHEVLTAAGARAAAGSSLRAPRLRSFVLDGVPAEALKEALEDARVVAPAIELDDARCMLRVATHVYTDEHDLERAAAVVRSLLRGGRRAT